jgi:hypothetical protein
VKRVNHCNLQLMTWLAPRIERQAVRVPDVSRSYLDKPPEGRFALHTDTARREIDEVCAVTGLLYDTVG